MLIILTLLNYGCKPERHKIIKYKDVKMELERYENKEHNITIEYPKNWKKVDGNQDIIFIVQMLKSDSDNKFPNTIHITSLFNATDTRIILDDLVKASTEDMFGSLKNFHLASQEEVDINNHRAIKIKCTFTSGDNSISTLLYYVQLPQNVYLVGLSGLSSKYADYEKAYEYIAKTFNVLN